MLPPDAPTEPSERLAAVIDAFTAMIVDTGDAWSALKPFAVVVGPRSATPLEVGRSAKLLLLPYGIVFRRALPP